MVGNFDYNNDEVMNILNNPNYTEDQKKELFEKYKNNLKEVRRKEIINRLNDCAKNNPIITQEEYVNFLKRYSNDDLSKPFEIIEKELDAFSKQMRAKYDAYLKVQAAEAAMEQAKLREKVTQVEPEPIVESPVEEKVSEPVNEVEDIDLDDFKPDVTPINYKHSELKKELKPTVFESDKEVKEAMPEDFSDGLNEKGNASAIIISIIAIIIGMVIMYSIIKLK